MSKIKNGLIVDSEGNKIWYKNGKLHRNKDLPAVEYANGNKYWYKNGELHRDNDKPAVEGNNGYKFWYKGGLKHRENGLPAIIKIDGTEEYWEHGEQITQEESLYRALHKNLPQSSLKSSLKKI